MRAETRHQLKQDRFSKVTLEAAEKTANWTVEHQSKLIAAVIAVVVIGAIAFGGWYYVNTQDEKASAELSTAVRTFETPVRPAGVPAQPGFDSFASSQIRTQELRPHPGSKKGILTEANRHGEALPLCAPYLADA